MNIREAIRQCILANANFVALVPADRLWLQFAPSGTAPTGPWVVMEQISGQETTAHNGNNNLVAKRYQFTIGGPDQEKVNEVFDILVQQFNGVDIVYNDGTTDWTLTFFNANSDDGWDEATRTFNPTVDMLIWTNY